MLKNSLQLKLSQQLTLTPQLQQAIRLLQLSTVELEQEIEQMLADNPLLERSNDEEDGETDTISTQTELSELERSELEQQQTLLVLEQMIQAYETEEIPPVNESVERLTLADITDTEWLAENSSSYGSGEDHFPEDEDESLSWQNQLTANVTLREHLISQARLLRISEKQLQYVLLIIEYLDERGLLTLSLEELSLEIDPEKNEVTLLDELSQALDSVQSLEPVGVGARSLNECLILQLKALDTLPEEIVHLALEILQFHLNLFASRDFNKLKRLLKCDDDQLREVQNLILKLDPDPCREFEEVETRYIVPDVIVTEGSHRWIVQLNPDALPRLRVNHVYANILQNHRERERPYSELLSQLQEAKWMIKNIQQRFETILKVSEAIVTKQAEFFQKGEIAMKPLVLRDIAEEVNLHESTISRVTSQKYMLTPRGLYELKYFFSSHVSNQEGDAHSATAIRALIKNLIANEESLSPLSDSKIAEKLAEKGIQVARRTVAKYRESMHIPAVNQRKQF